MGTDGFMNTRARIENLRVMLENPDADAGTRLEASRELFRLENVLLRQLGQQVALLSENISDFVEDLNKEISNDEK